MGVVSACALSFMSKYLHQSCGPKPMTRVDINDNNQSSNKKTVPGTPQENGVSERMNKTIMECARSMRLHVGFPLQLWVDVVDTIVYLINKRTFKLFGWWNSRGGMDR
jgi:hypothetical protein